MEEWGGLSRAWPESASPLSQARGGARLLADSAEQFPREGAAVSLQRPHFWLLSGGPWPVEASRAGTNSLLGVGVQVGTSWGLCSLCSWCSPCPWVKAQPSLVSEHTRGRPGRRLTGGGPLGPSALPLCCRP